MGELHWHAWLVLKPGRWIARAGAQPLALYTPRGQGEVYCVAILWAVGVVATGTSGGNLVFESFPSIGNPSALLLIGRTIVCVLQQAVVVTPAPVLRARDFRTL